MSAKWGPHHRSTQKQATYKYPLWSIQKQATCKVISRSTPKVADASPKKRAVPLPTATPTLATISGPLRNTNEELPRLCRDSRGAPLQCLPAADLPAAQQPEQPTNPHRVTLVLTPGPPTSSPMKEPPTPRPPNLRKYQKYCRHNGQITEDLRSPSANRTAKKTKAPNPLDTRERFEGPPSNTNTAHVPATDQRKPLNPGLEIPRNRTQYNTPKHHGTPPENSHHPRQTPGALPAMPCPVPTNPGTSQHRRH
ncbi:hypothetical protein E4T56_gene12819 [Termitomyces sp. T112]|nr:hypothetical protein E4T56_gene12819 [Termitomyces sp. T112]